MKTIFTAFDSTIHSVERTLHHGPLLQTKPETNRMEKYCNASEQWTQPEEKGVERLRWVYSKKVSSWGESVLYSPHVALVLSGLGQAGPGCAVPCRAGERASQESSDLLSAMASSRSSCSCWVSLASRSFSSRSLSRFAHSIMSSSVGYCTMNTEHTGGKERTHICTEMRGKGDTNKDKHIQLTDSQR